MQRVGLDLSVPRVASLGKGDAAPSGHSRLSAEFHKKHNVFHIFELYAAFRLPTAFVLEDVVVSVEEHAMPKPGVADDIFADLD
jgi:hypothetical protein